MKLLKIGVKAFKFVGKIKNIIPYLEFIKKLIDFVEKEFPKQDDKLNKMLKESK